MYTQFFGLAKEPFSMSPDPAFLYLTSQHRETLAGLMYSILDRKGFIVVISDAGTGKTTILVKVLQSMPAGRIQSAVVFNPTLTPAEFLELLLLDLGIEEVPASKAQRLTVLLRLLLEARAQGRVVALIVDEAHRLSPEVLEEIRLLGNFENQDGKLLQIVLLGQNELGDLLNQENLRQLKQRVALRFALGPFSEPDAENYVRHRWNKAGGAGEPPFTPDALRAVARWSRGIPRTINAICDNALLLAFAESSRLVRNSHVKQAVKDLDLFRAAPAVSVPAIAPAETISFRRTEPESPREHSSFVSRWFARLKLAG
jgi:type II secretory pathway predicted ATPase ExeA